MRITRNELIAQLRQALHQAESPASEVPAVEFELGDTDFCFEFDEED